MNRTVLLGLIVFFAVVAIALMGGQNQAVAGHGCHGCGGYVACDGCYGCSGVVACHGCSGVVACHGCSGVVACHGPAPCCGLFRRHRLHRWHACHGAPVCSGCYGCGGIAVQKGAVIYDGGSMQKGAVQQGAIQQGSIQKGAVQKGSVQKGSAIQAGVPTMIQEAGVYRAPLMYRRVSFRG